MSTYSCVSSICLVACAKRASSRSTGGILKNPGRKATSEKRMRNAAACQCERTAKSTAAESPRAVIEDQVSLLATLNVSRLESEGCPDNRAKPPPCHMWAHKKMESDS